MLSDIGHKIKLTHLSIGVLILVGLFFFFVSVNSKNKDELTERITVGVIAPFSGIRADAGEFTQNALILAQEEINTDKERKYIIDLIYEDSQYQPQVAVSAVQKLLAIDNINYIIGPYGSSQVLAVAPIVEKNKTILITPGGQSDDISHAGDYIFRNIHNAKQEAPIFAKFIAQNMEGDTVDLLVANVAFTESYLNNFIPVFESFGKQIGKIEYFDVADTDFRTELTKIKADNPTDIFPLATPKHMGLILEQAHELGINAHFYHIGVEGPDLLEIGGTFAEGLFYPYSYDAHGSEPRVKAFYNAYVARFGADPDTIAANAYDALYLLSDCFEKVGNNVEAVKKCLYEVNNYQGASGTYSIDENGDAIKEIFIKTVRDKKFIRYEE